MPFKYAFAVLAGISLFMMSVSVAYAVDNPDETSIGEVYVFRDLLEEGDQLFYIR